MSKEKVTEEEIKEHMQLHKAIGKHKRKIREEKVEKYFRENE